MRGAAIRAVQLNGSSACGVESGSIHLYAGINDTPSVGALESESSHGTPPFRASYRQGIMVNRPLTNNCEPAGQETAMLAFSRDYDDEPCPISDRALARLYSANECSLPELVDAMEPEIKPALALFCYRRAHLQSVGLAIAASCEETHLVSVGGSAGTALFARSREKPHVVQIKSASPFRRKITLSSGPLWNRPFEDEAE